MDKKAQEYLMALDTKKKAAIARGGQAAGDALVAEQKKKAGQLSGDDSKQQYMAAARKRLSPKDKKNAAPVETSKPGGGRGKPATKSEGRPGFMKNLAAPVANLPQPIPRRSQADKKKGSADLVANRNKRRDLGLIK